MIRLKFQSLSMCSNNERKKMKVAVQHFTIKFIRHRILVHLGELQYVVFKILIQKLHFQNFHSKCTNVLVMKI